jgi:hypothetical protein
MLLYRLQAAAYLALIIFLSVIINASKIAPESYGFVTFGSAIAVLFAFTEPQRIIPR